MHDAYIVGAVRSPIGKRNGGLSAVHPADLAAHVLGELIRRTGTDPSAVEDVVLGCVAQAGPQAIDIARTAWLSAGLPESVPGVTIDRQCGSSQQAIHFAAQGVLSGSQDLVIAGGIESMSMVPMGTTVALPRKEGLAGPYGQGWRDRYGDQEISQFRGAQLMCEKWGLKRAQLEEFSLREPRQGHRGDRRGQVRPRDHARSAGVDDGRGTAPGHARWRRWRSSEPLRAGLGADRRDGLADLRRRRRAADRVARRRSGGTASRRGPGFTRWRSPAPIRCTC